MQDTLVYLQRFDVSLNLALKIYKTYGARTEEVIKTNPYQLISDVERVRVSDRQTKSHRKSESRKTAISEFGRA